jgi:hypothetical protein
MRKIKVILLALVTALALGATAQAAPDGSPTTKAAPAKTSPATKTSPAADSGPAAPASAGSPEPADQPKGAAVGKPTPPTDVKGAAELAKEGVQAAKAKNWWYLASLACLLIMFILGKVGVLEKVGRWKYLILPVLALASALLAAFQGGVTWDNAVGVFTASWVTGMLEEAWNHGIRGKPHKTV